MSVLARVNFLKPAILTNALKLRGFSQISTSSGSALGQAATETDQSADEGAWGQTTIAEVLKSKKDEASWLWCAKDEKVISAIRKMAKLNVGSLLVVDPAKIPAGGGPHTTEHISGAVCGIVTERDYLTKVAVEGKSSEEIQVEEIMTPQNKLKVVEPRNTVIEAMQTMVDSNVRHLPVVVAGSMVGMLSIRDAVKAIVDEYHEEVSHLKDYISGTY